MAASELLAAAAAKNVLRRCCCRQIAHALLSSSSHAFVRALLHTPPAHRLPPRNAESYMLKSGEQHNTGLLVELQLPAAAARHPLAPARKLPPLELQPRAPGLHRLRYKPRPRCACCAAAVMLSLCCL